MVLAVHLITVESVLQVFSQKHLAVMYWGYCLLCLVSVVLWFYVDVLCIETFHVMFCNVNIACWFTKSNQSEEWIFYHQNRIERFYNWKDNSLSHFHFEILPWIYEGIFWKILFCFYFVDHVPCRFMKSWNLFACNI